MPNLKDIRNRIKSIKSTEKITLAMKMVAAAKVKRAENRLKANKPYAAALNELFAKVYDKLQQSCQEPDDSKYLALLQKRDIKRVGVIIFGSDRGLCGAYSANVIKQAINLNKVYDANGIEPVYYLIGNKVIRSFPAFCPGAKIIGNLGGMSASPSKHDAQQVMETVLNAFLNHQIDAIQILYTEFRSMISYKVSLLPLLPTEPILAHASLPLVKRSLPQLTEQVQHAQPELLIEPNPVALLDKLIPNYLENITYAAMLEAAASELAARMTAMSNASKNAKELIGLLTLQYNKARQAAITQEILEIVSGANAI